MIKRSPCPARYVKDVPTMDHYAVLSEYSFKYDDGYGDRYSPSTSTHYELQYTAFDNIEQLESWLLENESKVKIIKVIKAQPLTVQRRVSVIVQ